MKTEKRFAEVGRTRKAFRSFPPSISPYGRIVCPLPLPSPERALSAHFIDDLNRPVSLDLDVAGMIRWQILNRRRLDASSHNLTNEIHSWNPVIPDNRAGVGDQFTADRGLCGGTVRAQAVQ